MFKSIEEYNKLGQSQIEAATVSAAALSRGAQQIASEASFFVKRTVEDGSAATARLLGAKSLDGVVQVQSEYARAALAAFVAQADRMGSLMLMVGKDAAKPFEAVMPFHLGEEAGRR